MYIYPYDREMNSRATMVYVYEYIYICMHICIYIFTIVR